MQGLLSDVPLLGVLELIHSTRQTGMLEVQADVPFTVAFVSGQIVSGGILDWLGTEALFCTPMLPTSGSFTFYDKPIQGSPLGSFNQVTTDWARASDEWEQICALIGSPSRYFQGSLPLFEGRMGRSVRGAAREAEISAFQVAETVAQAVQSGKLRPLTRHEWFRLRLKPSRRTSKVSLGQSQLISLLDGENTLAQIITAGVPLQEVRTHLLSEIRLGLRFPGSGWVLRDLIWEQKYAQLPDPDTTADLLQR